MTQKDSGPPTSNVYTSVGLWAEIPPDSYEQPSTQTMALEY